MCTPPVRGHWRHQHWRCDVARTAWFSIVLQAPIVEKLEGAIHSITHSPAVTEKYKKQLRYPVDKDLSTRQCYSPLNSLYTDWGCHIFLFVNRSFRKPLSWRSINPPGFLYLSRALDGLRREKQRVCEQATFWTTGPCSVNVSCLIYKLTSVKKKPVRLLSTIFLKHYHNNCLQGEGNGSPTTSDFNYDVYTPS